MNDFDVPKDSSIWVDVNERNALNRMDGMIRIGIVKNAYNDADTGELRYLVETQSHGKQINMNCRLLRRFGGVYNYEDYIYQGYTTTDSPDPVRSFDAKAGDAVLVGQLNGQGREGIILGGLTHAARQTTVQATDGPQYDAEFNGVHTNINKDGEWTLTFKGIPTNADALMNAPADKIPAAEYDTKIGSSFMMFDKTGSWTVSDNSSDGKIQSIFIDKGNGMVTITAGDNTIVMDKQGDITITSKKDLKIKCDKATVDADGDVTVTSGGTAIVEGSTVKLGKGASEAVLKGDTFKSLFMAHTHPTAVGPSGPPAAPIDSALSTKVKTE